MTLNDVTSFVEFAKSALGAQVVSDHKGEDGKIQHVELKFNDSMVMAGENCGQEIAPAMLYYYVENCDEAYKRAMDCGATSVREPEDMFYGDRNAAIKDAWGNQWWFATHK